MELELWHMWLLLTVGLFVIEIFISNFISICFGIGALLTGIIAYLNFSITEQIIVFAAFSFLSLFIIKPFIKKHSFSNQYIPELNQAKLIGREAIVMEEINDRKNIGRIIISGSTWKAKSQFGEVIPKDSFVEVLNIKQSIITVKSI
ncbi:NfeD family protein [Labilibaculum sp. DW002]|uniref:NfeD family protein n=1 Tax=Paralabilibaculum antarcticum TaxID=2912572 RepID=A0ABT5VXT8_9BACT|nr:NfeD family protein [Labilibaculum sp. DW002]MDE5419323.1 NfeD family protein [Labilibaculum sp. DW002]